MTTIEVWDPRKGDNYELEDFRTKHVFSSLPQELFVIEATTCKTKQVCFTSFVLELLHGTQPKFLTIIIIPWEREKYYRENFDELINVDYSLSNYIIQFETNDVLLKNFLDVQEGEDKHKFGESIIIGSNEKLRLDKESITNGFSKILELENSFEFLVYIAEMHQYYFIFKPFGGVDLAMGKINRIKKN